MLSVLSGTQYQSTVNVATGRATVFRGSFTLGGTGALVGAVGSVLEIQGMITFVSDGEGNSETASRSGTGVEASVC